MVAYNPDDAEAVPDPDEVAAELATQLAETAQIPEEIVERVRTSETPLAVQLGEPWSSTGSLRSIIRYCVLKSLENSEKVIRVSFSKVSDEKWAGMTTHPSLLDQSNRLLPQTALATAYQYGYWPKNWRTVQGGDLPDSVESVADRPDEQRDLGLVWKDDYDERDVTTDQYWFADEKAVTEFAAHATDDDVSWDQYIPWYRTTAVSAYRLTQVAQTTDWSEFPDRPDDRPTIENRFDTSANPRVGDFIRMAVLLKLERNLPIITNLTTGPEAWATDRVTLVVDPTATEGRADTAILCPTVALTKLATYGYRPIDGWYDTPTVGYDSDDPIESRVIKFARGSALHNWCETMQLQSPLFEDATRVRETSIAEIDWETFIPCVQSQIISYDQLHTLAQNPDTDV